MKKRVFAAFLVAGVLWGSFTVVLASSAARPSGNACAKEYVVQSGDTLAKIASGFRISLADLIQLNRSRLKNPDIIYRGQKLCVSLGQEMVPSRSEPTDQVMAIEINYTFDVTDTERGWNLTARGGLLGRRSAYPLQKVDPIRTVSSTKEMVAALVNEPGPVLLVVQADDSPYSTTHTLVLLEARALTDLLPSAEAALQPELSPLRRDPRELCLEPRTLASLAGPSIREIRAELVLEDGGDTRPLIDIASMDLFFDQAAARKCYTGVLADRIKYALSPGTEADSYQMIVRDRPPGGQLVVDVDYHLTEAAARVAGSEFVGRRIEYPIEDTSFFSTSQMLQDAFETEPPPVLLTFRQSGSGVSYTLVTVGDARLLKAISLREVLTPTKAADDPVVPPADRECVPVAVSQLGAPFARAVTLTVRLENRDGVFYPFPISHVVSRTSIYEGGDCFGYDGSELKSHLAGLLMSPLAEEEPAYRASVQLQGTEIGPTGAVRAARCRYWPRRGRFNRWIRGWFGCR